MEAELGNITSGPSGYEVTLERTLRHPIEKVWAALTEPDQLMVWLMETTVLELHVGGAIGFSEEGMGEPGTITKLVPPTLIEYSWVGHEPPLSLVRFELSEIDSSTSAGTGFGTRLRLTHRGMQSEAIVVEHGAGWHTHLDCLDAQLDGQALPDFWPRFNELRPVYESLGEAVSHT